MYYNDNLIFKFIVTFFLLVQCPTNRSIFIKSMHYMRSYLYGDDIVIQK